MRKLIPIWCLILALTTTTVSAQVCQGDVVLTTQEEVNAFDCEILEGDLHLILSENLDLEPLSGLREVNGAILIDFKPDLDLYLSGLQNLTLAGEIRITANGGSSYDTFFDLSVFQSLDSIGEFSVSEVRLVNTFPALTRLYALSMYSSYFMDISWLENIESIHSLYFNTTVVAEQNEAFLSKIKEGGDITMMYSNFQDLGGLLGIEYLNTLELTGSTGKAYDGLYTLDSTNYFLITGTDVSEGCCGLAPYLSGDPKPIAFQFSNNSCTLNEILEECVKENVCEGDVVLVTQEDFDNFDCTRINGNLTIGSFDGKPDPPLNTANLKRLKHVTGSLQIIGDASKFRGLSGIESLGSLMFIPDFLYRPASDPDSNVVYLDSLSQLKSVKSIRAEYYTLKGELSSLNAPVENVYIDNCIFESNFLGTAPYVDSLSFGGLGGTAPNEALDYSGSLKKLRNGSSLNAYYINSFQGMEHIDSLNVFEVQWSSLKSIGSLKNMRVVNQFIWENNTLSKDYCGIYPLVNNSGSFEKFRWFNNTVPLIDILACHEVQPVCQGDIMIPLNTGIAAFNCEVVDGNLILENGVNIPDFPLSTLRVLKEVKGDLIIRNSNIFSLSDLYSLVSVGGNVIIENNDRLKSLQGLSQLTYIGGDLIVRDNPVITALGLQSLTHVTNIDVSNNNSLKYCCDVSRIIDEEVVGGTITIENNEATCTVEALTDCPSDPGVCYTDVYLNIQYDADHLICESITGEMVIKGHVPIDLDSLYRLKTISGNLQISQYDGFSFEGMHNLASIGGIIQFGSWGYYTLSSTTFDLDPLVGLRSIGGFELILNNLYGSLNLTESMRKINWGYFAIIEDISWIENVPSIDTIYIEAPRVNRDTISLGTIPDRVSEGGILYVYDAGDITLTNSVWNQKKILNRFEVNGGVAESLDFLATLEKVDYLDIGFNVTTDDVCGAYNLLKNGDIGELSWSVNYSVQYILDNCAPEVVNSLSVYPNPSGDPVVNLSWQEKGEGNTVIQVLDNNGREVIQRTTPATAGMQKAELNTTSLEPGFYLIRIISNGEVKLRRFVKQ